MNGAQIVNFFSLDGFTSQVFGGLAMRDSVELRNCERKRVMYVLNTDNSDGKGVHWCLVYFDNDLEEFFDPFGNGPEFYGFERLLSTRKRTRRRVYNSVQVQDLLGIACGAHCLFYGFHRARGYGYRDVMRYYDVGNLKKNDGMVIEFVSRFGSCFKTKLR